MPNLLLVPTDTEANFVRSLIPLDSEHWRLELCGFGPIASAARTGALISRHQPHRVILLGIAGTFDVQKCPIATARSFREIACHGIGVGCGDHYTSAADLGWPQFAGDESDKEISDRITLACGNQAAEPEHGLLLTSPTASSDEADVKLRLAEFPNALAEDMEGFAVAAACVTASIPLCVVRGISNRVGDRNKNRWDIAGAMNAACDVTREMMERQVDS